MELRRLFTKYPDAILVREKALRKSGTTASGSTLSILNKVVGVSDLYAWAFGKREFAEIEPMTVKKHITNNASAEKDVVADSLEQFVGKQEYACDDESDAVAVGISWLIERGLIDDPFPKENKPRKSRKKGARET